MKKQPKTWFELTQLMDFLSDCSPDLLRLPDDYAFYTLFRKHVPREVVLAILNEQIGTNDTALVANNFPYTYTLRHLPEVKHYCLWSRKGPLDDASISKIVNRHFSGKLPWTYSERKPNHKSVPEIWHCHVFVNFA